ncbi:MAG TPA: 6-bladed beta-propeller [Bacteroidales bacterium]|nr:6-bladed beta-propeller [Bacteroidales bacterium]
MSGLLSCTCTDRSMKRSIRSDNIYYINIEKNLKNIKPLPLSILGYNIEYILPETNNNSLLSRISNVFVTDSSLFISDGNRILHFNINGRFLKQIGTQGRGPGEYVSVSDFYSDIIDNEIYILSPFRMLVYDFEGNFIRSFKIDFPCNQFILSNDTLVFYPFNIPDPESESCELYFTNKSGLFLYKTMTSLKRVNRGLVVPRSCLYKYKNNLYFMEFGTDILYKINNGHKEPYVIFDFGKMKINPDPTVSEALEMKGKASIYKIMETDQALFITICWGVADSLTNCYYNKVSREFVVLKENKFFNDMDGGISFWPKIITANGSFVDFRYANEVLEKVKKIERDNSKHPVSNAQTLFIKMANKLNESSNPVVILIK